MVAGVLLALWKLVPFHKLYICLHSGYWDGLSELVIISIIKKTKMYAFIDGLCFAAGIVGFVLCFTQNAPQYCPIPIAWLILYPLFNEAVYNVVSCINGKVVYNLNPTSRIVYDQSYNLSFCGLEKMHPFDAQKYGNVFARLLQMGVLQSERDIIEPSRVPRRLLLEKMSKFYLLRLNYSLFVCKYIEMPLCFLPAFLLRWRVLNPMLLATQGTILSSVVAMKLKWSVNLSGGYHHASCQTGGGFCIYPDITLAIHYLQSRLGVGKVMIIDLDAHQGNGHERDHINRDDVFIVDAYNHHIYPGDSPAKQAISLDIPVRSSTADEQYIHTISKIEDAIRTFRPEFVLYNAGTDCLEGDPLGNLSITEQGIIKRDQTIFRMCIKNGVPITMVLSGGYQKINAEVIAKSIKNLYDKFDKNT